MWGKSPKWFMPISATSTSEVSLVIRMSVSGRPISLFRLPLSSVRAVPRENWHTKQLLGGGLADRAVTLTTCRRTSCGSCPDGQAAPARCSQRVQRRHRYSLILAVVHHGCGAVLDAVHLPMKSCASNRSPLIGREQPLAESAATGRDRCQELPSPFAVFAVCPCRRLR